MAHYDLSEFRKLIKQSSSILQIAHVSPDGDTLGSNLTLHNILTNSGHKSTIACVDTPGPQYDFLPGIHQVVRQINPADYDLIITVDVADLSKMSGYYRDHKAYFDSTPLINIDHHATNARFGDVAIVDEKTASVGQIMYYILEDLGAPLNQDIATWLMTALYFDTGSFQHSNTTAEVMRIAGELMKHNPQHDQIAYELFQKKPFSLLKLWGLTLSKLKIDHDRSIAWVFISKEDMLEVEASYKDLDGLIAMLHGIPGIKMTIVMSERENGRMKGSIRTVDGVDASYYASAFGGGGHHKAAGFSTHMIEESTQHQIQRFIDSAVA